MKQAEATPQRPFYSVGYRYVNGHTVYSCNQFNDTPLAIGNNHRTMSGTDDFALAKRVATACANSKGIAEAWVHETRDGYNHAEVFHATGAHK